MGEGDEPRSASPVTGRTALLAIIGDPIVQARTPALVNGVLAARDRDAVLVAMQVAGGDLGPVVDAFRRIRNLAGAVVTMPHKSAIVPLLDAVTPEARQIGACNTVRREPDGRLVGTMLDGEGFVAGLARAGHDVRGKRIYLAGAGGAAAGFAFAFGKHGAASLTIHNRTAARADELAGRIRSAWPALAVSRDDAGPAGHDIVVNATSLGMRPDDVLPIDPSGLAPGMLVADVVIHAGTPLLVAAAQRGCAVHPGIAMLDAQIELIVDFILTPPG